MHHNQMSFYDFFLHQREINFIFISTISIVYINHFHNLFKLCGSVFSPLSHEKDKQINQTLPYETNQRKLRTKIRKNFNPTQSTPASWPETTPPASTTLASAHRASAGFFRLYQRTVAGEEEVEEGSLIT